MLHDHDVVAVECQATLEVLGVQVHGRIRGDEEQRIVVQAAFGVHGNRAQGNICRMELGLVEVGVLLVGDFGLLLGPDGNHRVEDFLLDEGLGCGHVIVASVLGLLERARLLHVHDDRIADVIAVALDQMLDESLREVLVVIDLVGVLAQMQDDVRAALLAGGLADVVALDAVAFPLEGLVAAVCLRDDGDLVGDHERRVEADAELADDIDFLELIGIRTLEFERARMGDGAEVLVELVLGHANAIVTDGERAGILVNGDLNAQVAAHDGAVFVLERGEVELIERIRCVGDKLTQEDFAIGVDGVNHQVEQLFALCLEFTHGYVSFRVRYICTNSDCRRGDIDYARPVTDMLPNCSYLEYLSR